MLLDLHFRHLRCETDKGIVQSQAGHPHTSWTANQLKRHHRQLPVTAFNKMSALSAALALQLLFTAKSHLSVFKLHHF